TSIDVPWYDMLALGTTLLIKMIEDRLAIEKIGIRFTTKLVVRESTCTKRPVSVRRRVQPPIAAYHKLETLH
ncbi:MAG TPA: hypothetical protein VHZ07_14765, partial [Bryobacteraceae bacterium]|nr:hypothetical protein [Bryobacteraceae bacterium]